MFKTIKAIYKLINNPLTKFAIKLFIKIYLTINKWIFTLIIGPICVFAAKKMVKVAFKKVLPKMIKNYFTKSFPGVIKNILKNTFPINLFIKFFEKYSLASQFLRSFLF